MEKLAKTLIDINKGVYSESELISIIDLACNKIDIKTISGMARSENKTPRGIRISKQYMKIEIGGQLMAVKGLEENNLPF